MIIGLTGSIAMGKSETSRMFKKLGYDVFDADAAVHQLYGKSGGAVEQIRKIAPQAVIDNQVDRTVLAKMLSSDDTLLGKIEQIVHPLVEQERKTFISKQQQADIKLIILDVPLLFEAGRDKDVDKIVVVSALPEIQRDRALARPGMTAEKFEMILSRQLSDAEKRKRADFVINTSISIEDAFRQVEQLVAKLDPHRLDRQKQNA